MDIRVALLTASVSSAFTLLFQMKIFFDTMVSLTNPFDSAAESYSSAPSNFGFGYEMARHPYS